MKNFKILLILAIFLYTGFACTDSNNPNEEVANLKFYLTDNPGEYQQVNIDVKEVRVIVNDSLQGITSYPGIYNLLDFTNGKDTLLADAEFTEGYLSQIRLILGENNTVMVDSVLHDLKTPSAQTSGLKLNVHAEIVPGEAYAYIIDFDAQKSIVEKGNGGYNLKPVIRVFTEVLTGSIKGVISPADADSLINLVIASDSSITTISDSLGNFMFRGLEPGEYGIDILATSAFSDTTLTGIEVFAGETTSVDTVFFK